MASIKWTERIYSDGWHNAFTDLCYWKGRYYICFRNSVAHHGLDGEVVLIASEDLDTWERVAVPINTHGDDRDPHMVATDDRLYVYSGSWMIRNGERVGR